MRDHPEIENTMLTGYPYDLKETAECYKCENYIYDGDICYEYEGNLYCEECKEEVLKDFKHIFDFEQWKMSKYPDYLDRCEEV